VFDGTSMATPHVAGAAALLVQLHRGWTPRQVKSALVSTAGPAFGDTARTAEAPVPLEGGGLVNLPAANDPRVFTQPVSLSFADIDVKRGAAERSLLVRLSDAGNGAGTWTVELKPQSATKGSAVDLPASVTVPPGGQALLAATARGNATADAGDDYGFIVLRNGAVTRRIPYLFSITRPGLEGVPPGPMKKFLLGNTLVGVSRANQYRYPTSPFGPPPDYTGPPMQQTGAEKLYVMRVNKNVANIGVSVVIASNGAIIDPWMLGSPDENDVQGYAGTPVNVNGLMFDYRVDVGAAGAEFPRQKAYYVSIDSGRDQFNGADHAGRYVIRSWSNDVTPPTVRLITHRVTVGRPTIVAKVTDPGAGVDPLSLVIGYHRALVGAAAYDPISGVAIFPIPDAAPQLTGRTLGVIQASDYQETKNVNTGSKNILPNTAFLPVTIQAVRGPAIEWLFPEANTCVRGKAARISVNAGSTAKVRAVRFFDGPTPIATVSKGIVGLYATDWKTAHVRRGIHSLRATVVDVRGRTASAQRVVRVCP
jgi:hypothetical protein